MDESSIKGRLSTLKKFKTELLDLIESEKKSLSDFQLSISEKEIVQKPEKTKETKTNVDSVKTVNPGCVEIEVKGISVEEKNKYLDKRSKVSEVTFYERLKNKIESIPESNGSRYFNKISVNIGIVADEFLYNSLKDAANFIYITPENYKDYIGKLDLFFVATAWNGLNKEWVGLSNRKSKAREKIIEIIKTYKANGIKVAFYSKEDPVHYDAYVDLAAECDYIFTTEKAVVDNYKLDCNNDNAFVLSFGINPVYHNPIGMRKYEKEKEVFFSGSWYNKYPVRNEEAIKIFDGVIESGNKLKLVDRNYALENYKYFFPEKYLEYIVPSVNHNKLQKLHKLYNWSINLNTIKYSPSMFANRIYELQALGNIILSNYSIGVNNLFPNVFIINDEQEVGHVLNGFTDEEVYNHQILGIRRVMSTETAYDRIQYICGCVGIDCDNPNKSIAVIVKDKKSNVNIQFNNQSYNNKELITIDEFNDEIKSKFDMITFFDEKSTYGKFYLEDMINAFKYTNCDYITKDAYYRGDKLTQGLEHDYVNVIKNKNRTVFWANKFNLKELLEIKSNTEVDNGYSIDHFEFNENESVNNKGKVEKKYTLSVIIAAYNNGNHLLSKCFNSLRRSSLFNDMEIIIVDDGSTDNYTTKIIEYIEQNNSNVKSYYYSDGGSGSASRPRNKGFELSTSPYITYLDPDNEAVNDGYYKLFKEIEKSNCDMVIGNMLKLADAESRFDLYNLVLENNNKESILVGDKREFITKSKFFAMSIQALIFKRDVIKDNNLQMIEGVFGEDTIFYFELLQAANRVKVIDLDIHIYYAAVEGSSVNNITKRFFEKYVALEDVRINKYKKMDLLDEYMDKRFNLFIVNWYFKKLRLVNKEDRLESIKYIYEILNMYKPYVGKDFKVSEIREFYDNVKNNRLDKVVDKYS